MVSLRVTVAVCLLCVCVHGEEEQVENKLDSIQEKLNELSRDDPRGIFPEINLNVKGDNKKTKYRYREGDKVINLKEITFKRAKGKKGDTLPPFTLMTITQVPGDVEGSVCEVEVDETGTVFDATEEQVIPKLAYEYEQELERRKLDHRTNWAAMVEALIKEHAPKRVKKLPKLLKAWAKRENALYTKLRKDFNLPEDGFERINKDPSEYEHEL